MKRRAGLGAGVVEISMVDLLVCASSTVLLSGSNMNENKNLLKSISLSVAFSHWNDFEN